MIGWVAMDGMDGWFYGVLMDDGMDGWMDGFACNWGDEMNGWIQDGWYVNDQMDLDARMNGWIQHQKWRQMDDERDRTLGNIFFAK